MFYMFFYCMIRELNESARAHNEPTWADFLALVKITSQPQLARYLNEPERAEPARYPVLIMVGSTSHNG